MIFHIDMDAFFAAIEQRDNPEFLNKPIIIAGNSKRSVVSTASYEARKFGIRSAMPVFMATEKCSQLIIVPLNMKKYQANSIQIMDILSRFSPKVEQVSIDEAYMDIKGSEKLFGPPEFLAMQIKHEIFSRLSLTSSIGIAPLKFLAKIASDMKKPDGLTMIHKQDVPFFINTLPIQKVPGIGKSAMKQMNLLQIKTLGDIKHHSLKTLNKKFGKMGKRLLELANGIDTNRVDTRYSRKSISSETTLGKDISDFETAKHFILDRSQIVGKTLRKKNLTCQTVFIKLKFSDFSQITRRKTLSSSICSSKSIFDEAIKLYQNVKLKKKIRLIGVGVSTLIDKDAPVQLSLISDHQDQQNTQWEIVDSAMDTISEKFGNHVIKKASLNTLYKKRKPNGS